MIRQVLYRWGRLHFPWGPEDVGYVALGLSIDDPLSGRWECVEVVPGATGCFDSAIFKYMPYEWDLPPGRGRGPMGRALPDGKICFNNDGTLAGPETVINGGNGTKYCEGLGTIIFKSLGPETQSVNAATPWLGEDDSDYKVLWSGEVREKFDREIDRLERCKDSCDDYWRAEDKRNYRLQLLLLRSIKKDLGL